MNIQSAKYQARTLAVKRSATIAVCVDNSGNYYPVGIFDIKRESDSVVIAFDSKGKEISI